MILRGSDSGRRRRRRRVQEGQSWRLTSALSLPSKGRLSNAHSSLLPFHWLEPLVRPSSTLSVCPHHHMKARE